MKNLNQDLYLNAVHRAFFLMCLASSHIDNANISFETLNVEDEGQVLI